MMRFHDSIIRPLLEVLRPRTIVEIGVADGGHTMKLLEYARPHGAIVHAIDTKQPATLPEWQSAFGSSFVFHQGQSIAALAQSPAADIVFVDGDHNWFTVFHELQTIERRAIEAKVQSVIVLHDTSWPYARRDMYYDVETIPVEFRHEALQTGLVAGSTDVSAHGINAHFFHATHEGGPRNGVLTAIEDFIAESEVSYRIVHITGLHGLTLMVPQDLIAINPVIGTFIDSLNLSTPIVHHIDAVEQSRLELLMHLHNRSELETSQTVPQKHETLAHQAAINSRIVHLEEERTRLVASIDELLNSSSWKITLPMRVLRRVILAMRPRAVMDIVKRDLQILTGRTAVALPTSPATAPVTVIIRVDDDVAGLRKTLESLQRQSVRPQRIVGFSPEVHRKAVIDILVTESVAEWGGSTKPNWLEHWLCKDSRPYLLSLTSGDVLHPNYIRHGLEALNAFPSTGFAYSDYHILSNRQTVHTPAATEEALLQPEKFLHRACLARRDAFVQGCQSASDTMIDLWTAAMDAGWSTVKSRGMIFFPRDPFAPRPATESRDATLFVPLSGRSWMWPITSAFLERQTYPHERMHLVLLDTSQSADFSKLVTEWIPRSDYASISYEQMPVGRAGIADLPREEFVRELSDACALIYNTLARKCKTPLACILEDDVIPPDDAYVRLATTLWSSDAMSVSGVYRHRLSPRIAAWNWTLDAGAVDAPLFQNGLHETGGNGFGCLAVRGKIFRDAIFRAGPPYYNYDQHFYYERVFLRGQKALMDWDCRCKHYVNQNHWVVPL